MNGKKVRAKAIGLLDSQLNLMQRPEEQHEWLKEMVILYMTTQTPLVFERFSTVASMKIIESRKGTTS